MGEENRRLAPTIAHTASRPWPPSGLDGLITLVEWDAILIHLAEKTGSCCRNRAKRPIAMAERPAVHRGYKVPKDIGDAPVRKSGSGARKSSAQPGYAPSPGTPGAGAPRLA